MRSVRGQGRRGRGARAISVVLPGRKRGVWWHGGGYMEFFGRFGDREVSLGFLVSRS